MTTEQLKALFYEQAFGESGTDPDHEDEGLLMTAETASGVEVHIEPVFEHDMLMLKTPVYPLQERLRDEQLRLALSLNNFSPELHYCHLALCEGDLMLCHKQSLSDLTEYNLSQVVEAFTAVLQQVQRKLEGKPAANEAQPQSDHASLIRG